MNLEPLRDALLPCPWCGKEAVLSHMESGRWDIGCITEDCLAALTWGTFERKAEAIAAWNCRAPDPENQCMRFLIEAWHDIDRKRDADIERLRASLDKIETVRTDYVEGPDANLEQARQIARDALKGTGGE